MESKKSDRHKQVECVVCFKKVRSNNMRRHLRTHKRFYAVDEEELLQQKHIYEKTMEEIRLEKQTVQHEEKEVVKCTDDIARSTISFHALEAEMLKDDQKYLEMLERGKHIIDLLNKCVGREELLSKEN